MVKQHAGQKCWACRGLDPDVCHVIAKEDTQRDIWSESGLLDFPLMSDANAISLCTVCHWQFDHWVDLGFVFFPEDLDYFIKFEKDDRQERQDTGANRTVPTANQYKVHQMLAGKIPEDATGGLYQPIMVRPYQYDNDLISDPGEREQFWQMGLAAFTKVRQWHGHPLASLRRAFHVLGSPRAKAVLSKDQLAKLRELQDLYFTPLEPNTSKAAESDNFNQADTQRDPKRSHQDDDVDDDTAGPSQKRKKREKPSDVTSTRRSARTRGQQLSEKVWCPDFERWVTPHWTFSPEFTAEDVIRHLGVSGMV